MWPFIEEAQERGAKVVVIDPMRHRTARRRRLAHPHQAGHRRALALAMMNVIITEGLVDHDYVDELHGRLRRARRASAASTRPSRSSPITGIPADDIVTLAREYATTHRRRSASAWPSNGTPAAARPFASIACLPALVGAWRHVGGGILQLPLWAFPLKWDDLHGPT